MRVFIFGIGGTGSRVLRSLTMLLASGVQFNHQDLTVVPIIVDTDAHNGDTARTRDLLRDYYNIRKAFVPPGTNAQTAAFFNTPLRSFNRLDTGAADATDLDVQLNFQNQDVSFANFISFNSLRQVDKDVMELLYNDSMDERPELHLNLSVGFKGNPNIGCVVFNQLKDSPQFRNLENSFTQNDRVFIISSIFGGTGASGFPTLVKLIRGSRNTNLSRTKLGAITVMPYFNIETDEKSAINSAIFDTKTKAALSFYAEDQDMRTINALYYIADHTQGGSLPNVEGGREQVNNSHLVELIAATATIDFINKTNEQLAAPQHFEFGAESGGNPFTIGHFNAETKRRYIQPLVSFAYAAKIATQFIPRLHASAFYGPKELNIEGQLGFPGEYRKLLQFFEEFKKWTQQEMASLDNGRIFHSFSFDGEDHLNKLVHGKEITTGFFNKGVTMKNVSGMLSSHTINVSGGRTLPEKYLNAIYLTAKQCQATLGQLP